MPANSLQDLYQTKLQLILDAEQQGLQAYPQIMQGVRHDELRQAMQQHMQETQDQVRQLQPLLQGASGGQQRCRSMTALIEEAQQMVGQIQDADARDAYIIGAAQAIEHHEIAAYGTARAWAEELGRRQDMEVLDRILAQEKQTDQRLTRLAEARVNREAMSDREVSRGAQAGDRGMQQGGMQQGGMQQGGRGQQQDDRPSTGR